MPPPKKKRRLKRLSLSLPTPLDKQLEAERKKRGMFKIQEVIRAILVEYFAKRSE